MRAERYLDDPSTSAVMKNYILVSFLFAMLPAILYGQVVTRPGVYVQETGPTPPAIAQVETAVPVFIGYTERLPRGATRPTLSAQLIASYREYVRLFGESVPGFFLAQSVELFFDNGGGSCYILSVGIAPQAPQGKPLSQGLEKSMDTEAQLVLIPDAVQLPAADGYALQNKMLRLCAQRGDRFAILNTPLPSNNATQDFQTFRAQTNAPDLSWGAVYYPWVITPGGESIPPAGAIAGVYAQTDAQRGVWKAPANVQITGITGLSHQLSQAEISAASVSPSDGKSINPLKTFTGKGPLVWGSRTLAGNDNEWRYVPVRRMGTMIEQSIQQSLKWVVFEPNDANLWTSVEATIGDYLQVLWREGAFAGSNPQEAFFVKCGLGSTMTASDIQSGKLIVEIGFAPVRPAEFVVRRLEWRMP